MAVKMRVSIIAVAAVLLAGCGWAGAAGAGSRSGPVQVVAAENFWGNVAKQIGGSYANVVSIITNPNTDPHSYEPTPNDARSMATSAYVIENGAGYDPWVDKLVGANPVS